MKLTFPYAGILIVTYLAVGIGSSVKADEMTEAKSEEVKPGSSQQIKIASDIPFGQTTQVRDAVRNECNLGEKLSGFIKEYGNDKDLNIEQYADIVSDQGKVLHVEITGVQGAGGGAWSGPKSVSIQGALTENGKEVGTFHGSRHSGGGAFGGFKSTCAIFGRDVKALGKDVARWLKSPTMNASLGDG